MTETQLPDDPHRVPPQTTPVWQTELLLSGGVVVALLQLPPLIDAAALWWRPRIDHSLLQVLIYAHLYARLVVTSLSFAFVLHLAIRGWWIAEVGLNSIFPAGLNIERSGGGPNTRLVRQSQARPASERIEAADNFATLVFIGGTAIAAMSVAIGLITLTLAGGAAALSWALGAPERSIDFMMVAFGVLFVPSMLATLIDQTFGRHIGTEGRFPALLRALIRFSEVIVLSRIWSPMLLTLVGSARTTARGWVLGTMLYLVLLGVVGLQIAGGLSLHQLFPGTTAFPREAGALLLDSRHYANQRRDKERYSTLPYLPARVIASDWLALTVPLDSRRDAALLAERCTDLQAGAGAETSRTSAAAIDAHHARLRVCLDQLRPVHLNGTRIPSSRAQFHRDTLAELPALLYMIPIAELPAERHVLTVGHTPEPTLRPERHREDDPTDAAWTIPFWRQPER
jgi:hypothetical protein